MQTSHFVQNGETIMAFTEAGEGPALLLVHGFTGSKLDFQNQLPWFADLRRVIAYDQRGHGETSNQRPYTLPAMVDDLVGLLDVLDIQRCDLLGHSLGGMVALRAVLAHPDRFRSLILMDTAPAPLGLWTRRARRALTKLVKREGCEALLEQSRQATPSPAQQRGIDYLGSEEHWRRISVKLQQMDPVAFVELMTELSDHDSVAGRLGEIRCPATVIVGEHDAPFLAPSAVLAEGIDGARLMTIEGADHAPQYENADVWRQAVREHLQRTEV
ncbi:MAG: alpha/beta hydrolase [Pseudomonadales bacterium]